MTLKLIISLIVLSSPVLAGSQDPPVDPTRITNDNLRHCAAFPGEDIGARIRAATLDLPPSGGVIICLAQGTQTIQRNPFAGITKPVELILGPGSTFNITGSSWTISGGLAIRGQLTTLNYSGTGTLFDTVDGTDTPSDVRFEGLNINILAPATGWLRVGRTSEDFADANFRLRWSIRDVYVTGPGCLRGGCTLPRGSVGMSLTQYLNWTFDNVTILGFEQPALFDRGGNSHLNRVRFQAYRFGPKWTSQAGQGTAADGGSHDMCTTCEFLGPTTTGPLAGRDFGYTVEIDAPGLTFLGALYEAQPRMGDSQALIHITARGSRFRDVNGAFSWDVNSPKTLINTIVFDDGYFEPAFFGTVLTVGGFPPISFGTPAKFDVGAKAQFIGCSARLNELVDVHPPSKAVIIGALSNTLFKTKTEVHDQEGIFRVNGRPNYAAPPLASGKGFQIEYQDRTDQAVLSSFDSEKSAFKPVLAQASVWSFDFRTDVKINKRISFATSVLPNGTTTPSITNGNVFKAENSRPTTISNLTGGIAGQEIKIFFANDNTTLLNGKTLRLMGGLNFAATADDVISLFTDDGITWREVSRSVN